MSTSPVQPAPGPTPSDQLMQFASGYIASACVGVAAQLRIADLLDGGAKSVAELGRVSSANEDALYRVLRALASVGILAFGSLAPGSRFDPDRLSARGFCPKERFLYFQSLPDREVAT